MAGVTVGAYRIFIILSLVMDMSMLKNSFDPWDSRRVVLNSFLVVLMMGLYTLTYTHWW